MKNTKMTLFCLLSVGLIAFSGCKTENKQSDSSSVSMTDSSSIVQSEDIPKVFISDKIIKTNITKIESFERSTLFMLDDSCIFLKDGILYRKYFADNKQVEIGEFNYRMSDFDGKLIGDKLYFYSSEGELGVIDMYVIDISKNTIAKLNTEEHYNTLIPTAVCSKGMLSFKGDMDSSESYGSTYIDLYNSEENKFEIIVSYDLNLIDKTGESISFFYCSDDIIYVIVEDYENEYRLDTYDLDGKLIQSYEPAEMERIEGEYLNTDNEYTDGFDYFKSSTPSSMYVQDDYIFISNMSNDAIIFKLTDGKMIPVSDVIKRFRMPMFSFNLCGGYEIICLIEKGQLGNEATELCSFNFKTHCFDKIDLGDIIAEELSSAGMIVNPNNDLLINIRSDTNDGALLEHSYLIQMRL